MSRIIKIDFETERIFGFEEPKSKEVIDSLIMAIKMKVELPLFSVFKIGDNCYSLDPYLENDVDGEKIVDGGHHRAIAFLREKGFIYSYEVPKPNMPVYMLQQGYIDIKDIRVESNKEELIKRRKRYKNYL